MIEQAYASGYGPLKSGNDLKLWLVPFKFDNTADNGQEDLIKYARSQKDHSTQFIALVEYVGLVTVQYIHLKDGSTHILVIVSSQDYSKFAKEIPMSELDQINKNLHTKAFDDEGNVISEMNEEYFPNLMEKYFPQN